MKKRAAKFIIFLLGILLVANLAFSWWVFDPAKKAAYGEWRKKQKTPAEKLPTAKYKGDFYLYTANELSAIFRELGRVFNERHPDLKIWRTSDNNRALLKTAGESVQKPDVLAVSSEALINEEYFPKKCDWYISFASNEMVLLYTPNSQFAGEINQANWSEVLTREATRYGYLDPGVDQVGSRTVFSWQLAEKYYQIKDLYLLLVKNVRQRNVFKSSDELLTALNKGELDYGFNYRTFALKNNVKFVTLPTEINLGSPDMTHLYQSASFKLKNQKKEGWLVEKGGPILNLITIPREASHKEAAQAFLEFCLSDEGAEIMRRHGLIPLLSREATVARDLPPSLKQYLATEHVIKSDNIPPLPRKKVTPKKVIKASGLERPKPPVRPTVKAPKPPKPPQGR